MDQAVKTFENDAYLVEATQKPGCLLSLKINVKPKQAQKAYQKAVKVVNKEISVPGFRKGRAPDRTVISRYGTYIEQEWKEILINDAYRASLDLTHVYPLNKNSVQKHSLESASQEDGAVVHLAYEHYPQVPEINFSEIQLPPIELPPVAEKEIDEVIENIRRAHADWEDMEGRPAQEGDFVDVSIFSLQEDPPKPIVTDRRFELSEKKCTPWLKKLVVGLNKDESAEGTSEVDEEAEERVKKNFQPTQVRVTLHSIKKIILSDLDDEMAKKAGASSVDDLRSKIRKNLETSAQEAWNRKRSEALKEALLNKYSFQLPASIVESAVNERLANQQDEATEEEVSRKVDAEIRSYFLHKQIAQQGKVSVSNQELNEAILSYLYQNPYLYQEETDENKTRELVSRISENLMQRKIQDYALSQIQ